MSLVSKYHSDLVSTTHVHLAHECETRGNYRAAEHHFVQAGEWKLAVKMYRSLDMWEEAYKVHLIIIHRFRIPSKRVYAVKFNAMCVGTHESVLKMLFV